MCVDVTDFCTVDFACYPNTITPKRERAVHSIRLESRFRVLIGIFESIGRPKYRIFRFIFEVRVFGKLSMFQPERPRKKAAEKL